MTVGHELGEIQRTMEEVLNPKNEQEEKRTGESRLNVYEKTLRKVERTAGRSVMRTLAAWNKAEIRDREAVPTGKEVREKGGEILRNQGYEIESDSWFNP